jgi:hypothetical protein
MKRVGMLVTLLTPSMGLEPALVANLFCPGPEDAKAGVPNRKF